MKGFLFDQNLPGRLTFQPSLPVIAATNLGPNPTDAGLWDHAKHASLVIVSKDADFSERIILHVPPP
jgi:predicted nuclease of predicted toxin-antitoxin system